jgi:hypothetical protein
MAIKFKSLRMIYDYTAICLEMATRVFLHVQVSVAQDTFFFDLCLVPPYLVRGGYSLMKMCTLIIYRIP